jgi:MFS family permease
VPLGAAGVLFISTTNSLLQLNADDAMRGRVMALWAIVFLGSTPIGGPLTGLLARGFGVRAAVAVGGVAALATAAGAYWALRRQQLKAGTCEAPVCLPDGPSPGDAFTESVAVHTAGAPDDADGAAHLT